MAVSAYMDLTAMNAALKELYSGQVINNMVYADNPLFAMLPKFTEFGGKYYPLLVILFSFIFLQDTARIIY